MKKYLLALFVLLLSINCSYCLHAAANEKYDVVELQTSEGNIVILLYPDKAPETVKNFLKYVNSGFYNNTIFHRVIDNFMIQGGGYTINLKLKKTLYKPIVNESNNGLPNIKGTIAMARTSDPDSATSQFFINTNNNYYLDYNPNTKKQGYAVFGEVIKGMNVVEKIEKFSTHTVDSLANVPEKPVVIYNVFEVD